MIAAALALNMEDCEIHEYGTAGAIGAAIALADTLSLDNPFFDRKKFLLDSGVPKEQV